MRGIEEKFTRGIIARVSGKMLDKQLEKIVEINSFKYAFMSNLIDDEGELHIFISGSMLGEQTEQTEHDFDGTVNSALAELIAGSVPIVPDQSAIYEIIFESYIGYNVRDESFTSWNPDEEFLFGLIFRLYTKSAYLDYLNKSTFASQIVEYRHYGIYCVEQVIDVASEHEPIIIRHTTN